ncbi:hypothetical protein FNF31_06699 [Cafeteria roenbergensis]|uniref:eRF1 domain-containing protein n=1 Tax=Cafeteria roenbergensis TaxID=33653 RepID=A0A5A8CGF8_CAFRO|nr:hypothetical protein FNF31_06699 [Cafeteria roenbergensis]
MQAASFTVLDRADALDAATSSHGGLMTLLVETAAVRGRIPAEGLAVFVGGAGGEEAVLLGNPESPFRRLIYYCGNAFDTAPLRASVCPQATVGVVAVSGTGCIVAVAGTSQASSPALSGGAGAGTGAARGGVGSRPRVLHRISTCVPSKHQKGGQSAPRFGRIRDECRHALAAKIAAAAALCLRPPSKGAGGDSGAGGLADAGNGSSPGGFAGGSDRSPTDSGIDVSAIVLAGPDEMRRDVMDRLPEKLRRIVVAQVTPDYSGEAAVRAALRAPELWAAIKGGRMDVERRLCQCVIAGLVGGSGSGGGSGADGGTAAAAAAGAGAVTAGTGAADVSGLLSWAEAATAAGCAPGHVTAAVGASDSLATALLQGAARVIVVTEDCPAMIASASASTGHGSPPGSAPPQAPASPASDLAVWDRGCGVAPPTPGSATEDGRVWEGAARWACRAWAEGRLPGVDAVFVLGRGGGSTEAGAMVSGMGGFAALLRWPVLEASVERGAAELLVKPAGASGGAAAATGASAGGAFDDYDDEDWL